MLGSPTLQAPPPFPAVAAHLCTPTTRLTTWIMAMRVSNFSCPVCILENSFSANVCGSCMRCRAAKLSLWLSWPLRAAFFTVYMTRFSLRSFFFLLDRVPCRVGRGGWY